MDEKNKREFTDGDFSLSAPVNRPYAPPAKRDTGAVDIGQRGEADGITSSGFRIPPAGRDTASSRNIRTSRYSSGGADFSRRAKLPKQSDMSSEVKFEYEAAGMLLRSVTVSSWPNTYSFYEKFVGDAHMSHGKKGSPAPHVPFFSYIPQYSQLKADQWAYYLYMRERLREGVALRDADFSYVLLYIYEVINLEGVYSPSEGAEALACAWSLYRGIHPMLDKYMSEWMADYCLVFRTPLPKSIYSFLTDAAARVTLKEFYVDAAVSAGREFIGPVIRAALSDYSPERSRYGKEDAGFVRDVEKVFDEVVPELMRPGKSIFAPGLVRDVKVTRDAYCGSLCSSSAKKKISLTLSTFMRSAESRRLVTELMKSCENIVRARRGIKARLSAPVITAISISATARTEEEAKYLAFYDSPEDELTPERAAEIEAESWQNTAVLTEIEDSETEYDYEDEIISGAISYGGADTEEPDTDETPAEFEAADECDSMEARLRSIDERLWNVLIETANGGSFGEMCRDVGLFADDAAAKINEAAMDMIGDIVLEQDGTSYIFIDDYTDDIRG